MSDKETLPFPVSDAFQGTYHGNHLMDSM